MKKLPGKSDAESTGLLLRIVLWESASYADSLAEFLSASGRPFLRRPHSFLAPPVGVEGAVAFELFVVPIDIGQLCHLMNQDARNSIGREFQLDDLPLVCLYRKRPPRDPNEPHAEFGRCLEMLPRWHSDSAIDRIRAMVRRPFSNS
jgi:hypothetical protein